jgi:cytochrome c oxidase cbb3-type subunit 3
MKPRRLLIGGTIAVVSLVQACKREERGFRVDPPKAEVINAKALSTLHPGGGTPPTPVKNDYEENSQALSEGKQLYSYFNCVGCHAHGGGGMGPPLMDPKWIYGSNPEQVFATIVEGRPNGMPSFRGRIPDHQVWQIAAYVRSMSGLVRKTDAPNREDDLRMKLPENSMEKQRPVDSGIPKSAEMP